MPFPVIGGFLGATGWLMIAGAVQVVTEQKLLLANLGEFANVPMLGKIAAALVVAVILQVALRRSNICSSCLAFCSRRWRRLTLHFC